MTPVTANKLPIAKRAQILSTLCEGGSMRSISRVVDVIINTMTKLLEDAGAACAVHHDLTVRGIQAKRVQCDEIWNFTYAEANNMPTSNAAPESAGDVWTWTALDTDTNLIVSYLIGGRNSEYANDFMLDVALRLASRVQLTKDGLKAYLDALEEAFGLDVDYAQLVRLCGDVPDAAKGRYSPAECTGIRKRRVEGNPDPDHVRTSYVERQNLTMRMSKRRFTRLTNAFSKKVANHENMVALYTTWYNFVRQHKTFRCSPAMAAGLTGTLWSMEGVVALIDARAVQAGKRGSYKLRAAKAAFSN